MTAARIAAACLVLAALAGASPRARAAALAVTVGTDSATAPAPGSLRYVLQNEAAPGDTIFFAEGLAIPIRGVLVIPPELSGLSIEGPVELRGGRLEILADTTTVQGVRFAGTDVVWGSESRTGEGAVKHGVVRDSVFASGARFRLAHTVESEVRRCTFDVKKAVTDEDNQVPWWIENTFRGRAKPLFSSNSSESLLFDRNTVEGPAAIAARSGVIEKNDIRDRLTVTRPAASLTGDLDIFRNQLSGLTASRPDLTVAWNDIAGARTGARSFVCSLSIVQSAGSEGFLRVLENNVTAGGFGTGLFVGADGTASEVLVDGNTVRGGSLRGMHVDTGSPCLLLLNVLEGCGGSRGAALVVDGEGATNIESLRVEAGKGLGIQMLPGAGECTVLGAQVKDCAKAGLSVTGRPFVLRNSDLERCGAGALVGKGPQGLIAGCRIRDNAGAGVFVSPGAQVQISEGHYAGNAGPGIDLSPAGVTPNERKRKGNRGIPWPDELAFEDGAVSGRSLPGARIEVFLVEAGPRAGNPKNGEGDGFLTSGIAGSDGRFSMPVPCDVGEVLTLTATSPGADPVTSEFSGDVECGAALPIDIMSQDAEGAEGADDSATGAGAVMLRNMSGDGRYVVFQSSARNLDDPGVAANLIYLRDTLDGATVRIQRTHDGAPFDSQSVGRNPSISSDGRFVVYEDLTNQVIANDHSADAQVVLYDRSEGTTTSVTRAAHQGQLPSGKFQYYGGTDPEISGDGSAVVFSSYDPDWVTGDAGTDGDFFVWTRATDAFERVSVPTGGGDVTNGTRATSGAAISHDGRFVAFATQQQLVPGRTGVYVRDRVAGTTLFVGPGYGPRVSDDGRYVAFSTDQALAADDTNGSNADIYLWDRQSPAALELISRNEAGNIRGTYSIHPFLSGDGRFVAYQVSSTQVELYDRVLDETTFLYQGGSRNPALSRDGSLLTFESAATDLLPGRTTTAFRSQVYLRRLPPPAE